MRCTRQSTHSGGRTGLGLGAACFMIAALATPWPTPTRTPPQPDTLARAPSVSSPPTIVAHVTIDEPANSPESITGGISRWAVPVPPAHEVQRGEPASAPATPTRPGVPIRRRRLAELG